MKKHKFILAVFAAGLSLFILNCGNHHNDNYGQEGDQDWHCGGYLAPTYEDDPNIGYWKGETEEEMFFIDFYFSYNNQGDLKVELYDPTDERGWLYFTISKEDLEDGVFSYTPDNDNDGLLVGFYISFQLIARNAVEGYLCIPDSNGSPEEFEWRGFFISKY